LMTSPLRLPDATSINAALAGLEPATADADLVPALAHAFPGFHFSVARIDDDYWRDTRSVIRADGTRIGELRPWMTGELAKDDGDLDALWRRLKETDLHITEWRGTSAFVFAPTGFGAADYIQIALGREIEWRAGQVVNPDYRPFGEEELFDPGWIRRDEFCEADRLVGPVYRLLDRAGGALVHLRSFLGRCGRVERERREAKRLELERRVIQEIGPGGTREIRSSKPCSTGSSTCRASCASSKTGSNPAPARSACSRIGRSISATTPTRKEREVGFIPRPLRPPKDRLLPTPDTSVHILMDRMLGLPFGWFFLMTHGHWVEAEIGQAVAAGLREQRVRLADRNARVLLRWADKPPYGF
jgi:hypothetical protein